MQTSSSCISNSGRSRTRSQTNENRKPRLHHLPAPHLRRLLLSVPRIQVARGGARLPLLRQREELALALTALQLIEPHQRAQCHRLHVRPLHRHHPVPQFLDSALPHHSQMQGSSPMSRQHLRPAHERHRMPYPTLAHQLHHGRRRHPLRMRIEDQLPNSVCLLHLLGPEFHLARLLPLAVDQYLLHLQHEKHRYPQGFHLRYPQRVQQLLLLPLPRHCHLPHHGLSHQHPPV